MRHMIWMAALVACASTRTVELPRSPRAADDSIDRVVRETLGNVRLAGLTVAVARAGRVVFVRGYGHATAGTSYHIGSVTKPFTAAAILQLVEAGKLQLDEPIAKLFPDDPALAAITIRQLLAHTSGIYDFVGDAPTARLDHRAGTRAITW